LGTVDYCETLQKITNTLKTLNTPSPKMLYLNCIVR